MEHADNADYGNSFGGGGFMPGEMSASPGGGGKVLTLTPLKHEGMMLILMRRATSTTPLFGQSQLNKLSTPRNPTPKQTTRSTVPTPPPSPSSAKSATSARRPQTSPTRSTTAPARSKSSSGSIRARRRTPWRRMMGRALARRGRTRSS